MVDRIGQQFGNYRLVRLLGRGGFADVYLGEHRRLNTYAAIKVLHTHLSNDDIEKFQKEAQTIANLRHPSIVRVLDFDVEGNIPFLVMEHAPHGSLRDRHPKGSRLPLPTIVSYVKQVASALQYAHDQRVVHRDVKPENMLLGPNGEVLLSDFGIAVVAHSTLSQTPQMALGTPYYMAPEQTQSGARSASDQYSLGAVVYEWLCGAYPFDGTSFIEIAMKHLTVPPPPLHEKNSAIPLAVEQIVMIALAKDPQRRFASVQAFASSLEQASQPARLGTPLPPPQLQRVYQPIVYQPPVEPIIPPRGAPAYHRVEPTVRAKETSIYPHDQQAGPRSYQPPSKPQLVPRPRPWYKLRSRDIWIGLLMSIVFALVCFYSAPVVGVDYGGLIILLGFYLVGIVAAALSGRERRDMLFPAFIDGLAAAVAVGVAVGFTISGGLSLVLKIVIVTIAYVLLCVPISLLGAATYLGIRKIRMRVSRKS